MLLRGSRRGLRKLGSLLLLNLGSLLFFPCLQLLRGRDRASGVTNNRRPPVPSCKGPGVLCGLLYAMLSSRGLAGLALRADARSSACELRFDATPINA